MVVREGLAEASPETGSYGHFNFRKNVSILRRYQMISSEYDTIYLSDAIARQVVTALRIEQGIPHPD